MAEDFSVYREGDWSRVSMLLSGLGARIKTETDKESKSQAMRAQKAVVAGIESQAFGFAQLSPEYKASKEKKGLDPRILIATGTYLQSITYWKEEPSSWVVGVRKGASHDGVDLNTLGVWLEYGTSGMPARPHFRPVAQQMESGIAKGYSTAIRKAMML